MESNKTVSVFNGKNWGIALSLAVMSLVLIFFGNFLYFIIVILLSDMTLWSLFIGICVVSVMMTWLTVWILKDHIVKHGPYNPAKVPIYSSVIFSLMYILSSLYIPFHITGNLDVNLVFQLIGDAVVVAGFYFLTKHYVTVYSRSPHAKTPKGTVAGLGFLQVAFSVCTLLLVIFFCSNIYGFTDSSDAGFAAWLIGFPVLFLISAPLAICSAIRIRILNRTDWVFFVLSSLIFLGSGVLLYYAFVLGNF